MPFSITHPISRYYNVGTRTRAASACTHEPRLPAMLRLVSVAAIGYASSKLGDKAWSRADRLAHQTPVAMPEELYAPLGTTIDFYGAGHRSHLCCIPPQSKTL